MLGSTHETGERSLQTGRPKGRPKNLGSNGAKLIAAASAVAATAEIARDVVISASLTAAAAAQEWTNRTLAVHERVDSRILVLPGSESTITEITEYIHSSPLKPRREFQYKSE